MSPRIALLSTAVVVCVLLSSTTAQQNPSTYWDSVLRKDLIRTTAIGGSGILSISSTARIAAIMHGSIFDAHNCFVTLGDPIIFSAAQANVSCASDANNIEAAMGAAHGAAAYILRDFFNANATFIDSRLTQVLDSINSTAAYNASATVGVAFASKWLADRASDGFLTATNITGEPQTRGKWRNFPDSQAPWTTAGPALAAPFTMNQQNEFRVGAPVSIDDASYKTVVDQVASKGSITSTNRTAEETTLLQYWIRTDNIGFWFDAAADLAVSRNLPPRNVTILFSMLAVGQYDAIIAATDSKKHYFTWRPRSAIRDSQLGNQPDWNPYLESDNSPEYPSTTGTLAMTSAKILINYFKQDNGLSFSVGGTNWTRISLAANDEGYSKILEGVHFSTSVDAGLSQGARLADHIYTQYFSLGAPTAIWTPSPVRAPEAPLGLSAMGAVGLAVLLIVCVAVIFALIFFCTPLKKRLCPPTTVE